MPRTPLMLPSRLSPGAIRVLLGDILNPDDYVRLSNQARAHEKVEKHWKRRFREAIFEAAWRALDTLAADGELDPEQFDFDNIVVENAIDAMRAGLHRPKVMPSHLAAPKPPLRTIFQMWDQWRKSPSKRQKKNAKDIKKVFLHTVQQFWKQRSREFRRGDVYDIGEAREAFSHQAAIPVARANMVVQTETTRYYNNAITILYKHADGVTHYLFAAILDRRTTKWCCEFHKGGRHGLVYAKSTALTERETPPCHWNCRSQFLPLSLSNPRHRKLIEDTARQRSGRSPAPLPKGWNQ